MGLRSDSAESKSRRCASWTCFIARATSATCVLHLRTGSKLSLETAAASIRSASTISGAFASRGPGKGRPMSKSSTTTKEVATPNRVTTHPGELLSEEFLRPLGMSVNALAMSLRVPATRIGAIVKGERSVPADTALRLARFFGTTAEFWMNMQAMHDLTRARAELGGKIERDVRPRAA